jgi:hypothetical protein
MNLQIERQREAVTWALRPAVRAVLYRRTGVAPVSISNKVIRLVVRLTVGMDCRWFGAKSETAATAVRQA